jgi:PIN domain nuclease of toxin-antitoxin system
MKLLADTHVVVWWLLEDARLSRRHRSLLARHEADGADVGVCAISLWEIAKLAERGRLELVQSLDESLSAIEASPLFTVLPLTARIVAESTRLGPAFPTDPADQLIAAAARCHGLALLTADERIRGSGAVAIG